MPEKVEILPGKNTHDQKDPKEVDRSDFWRMKKMKKAPQTKNNNRSGEDAKDDDSLKEVLRTVEHHRYTMTTTVREDGGAMRG